MPGISMPRISMIVALGRNRVIGADNVMPWHIPADLRYFRDQTLNKPVIMGRRTLLSMGGPLKGRSNIVITRDPDFAHEGVSVARDPDEALALAREIAAKSGCDEIMIIGGGQIFQQMLAQAQRLYLTELDLEPAGDTVFPDFRAVADWQEYSRDHHPAADGQPSFDFVIYDRQ